MPQRASKLAPNKAWLVRITTVMAAAVALLIAVAFPTVYLMFEQSYHHGKLEADASNLSFRITRLIADHPLMWRFRIDMLNEILERFTNQEHKTLGQESMLSEIFERFISHEDSTLAHIAIYDSKEIVTQSGLSHAELNASWLIASASHPIHDSGHVIGRVEIGVPLGSTIVNTLLLGAVTSLLGLIVFLVLRQLPLRALEEALKEVNYLASHDPLTNLPNRALFRDRLQQALTLADRHDERVAVLCVDLDHFKDVNDTLGHGAGDELLRQVTDRFADVIQKGDTLARMGGDEFAVVQNEVREPEGVASLAQQIVDMLAQPFQIENHHIVIGGSVGIALYPADDADPDNLLKKADLALYAAKAEGRSVYRFFEEGMNTQLVQRKSLEAALRRALVEDQFELVYQPLIEIADGSIRGVEALLRWRNPEHGPIMPAEFIPLAEATGIIIPITEWVLRRACLEARNWAGINVAVNLSPVAFRNPNLVEMLRGILTETGLEPHRLELEITEASLLQDTEGVLATLQEIKKMGIRVAMDDFGTGYSSLSYLQKFPFDKIKIDRSFITNLENDPDSDAIVSAIINLGRCLGMTTTAEGVETAKQAAFLAGQGCGEIQGFYFARPISAADLASLIDAANSSTAQSFGSKASNSAA